ncbi:hypothetical protein [Agrococcus carbonis]|uniref:Uncharacterized protein n=1 Tax=Agrococcus carbonis TaxID=684552 RepID=A0A1H1N9C9_9MICO|nr:hypothetical protein [Agrococcus carbonis]SDR95315.1 hypothetical protein SAMN04489719_1202 [Agrococcus carbonis]
MSHPAPHPHRPAEQSGQPGQIAQHTQPAPGAQQPQYGPHPTFAPPAAGEGTEQGKGKAFAIVAMVFAVLELLSGPVRSVVFAGLLADGAAPSMIGPASAALATASAVLALLAIGFGLASLLRGERARVIAGSAIGVGAAAIVGALSGLLQGALISAL